MARPDLTCILDALFNKAADLRTAAADMRPVTPAEFQQQRALLALATRIRTDVARIGNAREEGNFPASGKNLPAGQVSPSTLAEAA